MPTRTDVEAVPKPIEVGWEVPLAEPASRGLRAARVLSAILVGLLATASGAGLFVDDLYQYPAPVAAMRLRPGRPRDHRSAAGGDVAAGPAAIRASATAVDRRACVLGLPLRAVRLRHRVQRHLPAACRGVLALGLRVRAGDRERGHAWHRPPVRRSDARTVDRDDPPGPGCHAGSFLDRALAPVRHLGRDSGGSI